MLHTQRGAMHQAPQAENVPHPGDPAAPAVLGHSRHATGDADATWQLPFRNQDEWMRLAVRLAMADFPSSTHKITVFCSFESLFVKCKMIEQ